MDDLITRLTAAIADTEDVAQHALSAGWRVNITIDVDPKAAAEHAIRHDPTSVLRGCAADRKILALHPPLEVFAGIPVDDNWPTDRTQTHAICKRCANQDMESGWDAEEDTRYPCATLRAVAERYGLEAGDG